MTDHPMKLFSDRTDQYPQSNGEDTARAVIENALQIVPVFGPAANFILSRLWIPSVNRRMEEWLKGLAEDFEKHCNECNVENLVNNEVFISASIQAARIAVSTEQEEKRRYLRNALLNIACGNGPDEVRQQLFFNAVEAFAPAHVKALNLIWSGSGRIHWEEHGVPIQQRNYGSAIEIFAPELKGQPTLINAVLTDLRNRGFSNLSDGGAPFPQGSLITNLGIEFLHFVLGPEDLPGK